MDAEEGAPPKKLACNRGENPYIVADRFLQQEELPTGYREQVWGKVWKGGGEPVHRGGPIPPTGGAAYGVQGAGMRGEVWGVWVAGTWGTNLTWRSRYGADPGEQVWGRCWAGLGKT